MTLENLSPEKGNLQQLEPNKFNYDLGSVKKNQEQVFELLLKNAQHERIKVGCGSCTKADATQQDNDIHILIRYNASDSQNRPFSKTVTEYLKDNSQVSIKFSGTII